MSIQQRLDKVFEDIRQCERNSQKEISKAALNQLITAINNNLRNIDKLIKPYLEPEHINFTSNFVLSIKPTYHFSDERVNHERNNNTSNASKAVAGFINECELEHVLWKTVEHYWIKTFNHHVNGNTITENELVSEINLVTSEKKDGTIRNSIGRNVPFYEIPLITIMRKKDFKTDMKIKYKAIDENIQESVLTKISQTIIDDAKKRKKP